MWSELSILGADFMGSYDGRSIRIDPRRPPPNVPANGAVLSRVATSWSGCVPRDVGIHPPPAPQKTPAPGAGVSLGGSTLSVGGEETRDKRHLWMSELTMGRFNSLLIHAFSRWAWRKSRTHVLAAFLYFRLSWEGAGWGGGRRMAWEAGSPTRRRRK